MAQIGYYQHGDVLIIAVAAIPEKATSVASRILAEGEITHHAHRLTDASDVEMFDRDGTLYLRVGPGGAEVVHEEHGLGVLAPGDYQIGHVQEYDHFLEEARTVRD